MDKHAIEMLSTLLTRLPWLLGLADRLVSSGSPTLA
jgi:hypothetical protein